MKTRFIFILLIIAFTVSCDDAVQIPSELNSSRIMNLLEIQTELGPRVPGTEPWKLCQKLIIDTLTSHGLKVDSQTFDWADPYSSETLNLMNIIGKYQGTDKDETPVLLLAHYDSRPRTDYHTDPSRIGDSLIGANDGASGVAVLLELARLMAVDQPKINVDFLFVDCEDWGRSGDSKNYLIGSNYFATHKGNIKGEYLFAIILDMVGSKTAKFYREGYSERFNKNINDLVWNTAATLGVTEFVDSVKPGILDDHMSINVGGVPAIDIIDLDYPHWHTEKDIAENCSGKTMKNVGRVIAHVLYNKSLWPKD